MLTRPAGRLILTAARRGLLGGRRTIHEIQVLLLGGRVLRWIGGRSGRSLSVSGRLDPGDRIEITSLPPHELDR